MSAEKSERQCLILIGPLFCCLELIRPSEMIVQTMANLDLVRQPKGSKLAIALFTLAIGEALESILAN